MRTVAVFFHPFKKYEKISDNKFKVTHFRIWYTIHCEGVFVASYLGNPRSHTGITPNSTHFIAMAEALCDPCLDRFDDAHTSICLVNNHTPIHQRLQRYLLNGPESLTDDEYGKTVNIALRFIDRKRTASMHAEPGSKIRAIWPFAKTIFEQDSWVKSNEDAPRWKSHMIDTFCTKAVNRHREHLLRLHKPTIFADFTDPTNPS